MDEKRILEVVATARAEGRDALTEVEGLSLLAAMGVPAPSYHFVKGSSAVDSLAPLPGAKAVVKVISPAILHKTEMGGVAILPNNKAAIKAAMADMESRFTGYRVDGYTVNEFVPYEPRLGHEIIVGYRFARDFGPVVSFGPGGIYTEFLAGQFRSGAANVFFSPVTADRALVQRVIKDNAVRTLLCGGLRGTKAALDESLLVDIIMAFIEAGEVFARAGISEFEVNPFVVAAGSRDAAAGSASAPAGRLVALDVLVKLDDVASGELALEARTGRVVNRSQALRPVAKIDRILAPRSAAVIGVSDKGMNNGRIILRNLVDNGFDTKHLYVVKAGTDQVDGCRCVPDVASLPEKVDLFVLVIPAAQAPACIAELAELDKAEGVIVIPGGLEEKSGTEEIVARMRVALDASRSGVGGGPLLNGGNCLGIRSVPGKYNTLFIPEYKLPMPKGDVAPLAVLSQSGAFAICRISKHADINPKYVITCGNQMDLTVGDYLERLESDQEIQIFAVYIEGFKPLDGEKVLKACRRIVDSGRTVIFYRAGRTAAGAAASASHTASIAGDYPVTRELLGQLGVVVAGTLDEFDDLVTLFSLLHGKEATGLRLGAVSNAGFECVAFADNLGRLSIAEFSPAAGPRLQQVFADAKISEIVDVHNPIDLTPMADDAAYYESFRAVMEDENVDTGIVGIVPLTVRMNTLAAAAHHTEDVSREDSIAGRYGPLIKAGRKPWVAVVDSGDLYDPLVRQLEGHGVPTFRTADRALKMLNIWLEAKGVR
ncbi:MAG: acetate--CoA ligase family protein [Clostridia bacterium]|jgi:acyl-CoA synthetase (NDP forming)